MDRRGFRLLGMHGMLPERYAHWFFLGMMLLTGPCPGQERAFFLPDREPVPQAAMPALGAGGLRLFGPTDPLGFQLSSDFRTLLGIRADAPYQPAGLQLTFGDSLQFEFDLSLQPRGNARLAACYYPPLKLNFPEGAMRLPVFEGLDKIKLVAPCLRGDAYRDLVLKEYLVYQIYELLTPLSFRTRLLDLSWRDTGSGDLVLSAPGFLIEEEERFARRWAGEEITDDELTFADLDEDQLALLALFELMIGNADWTVGGRNNLKVFRVAGKPKPIPVPYDFDYADMVDAQYFAVGDAPPDVPPAPLQYKGPCMEEALLEQTAALFRDRLGAIRALILNYDGLPPGGRDGMVHQLDRFVDLLDRPGRLQQMVRSRCP